MKMVKDKIMQITNILTFTTITIIIVSGLEININSADNKTEFGVMDDFTVWGVEGTLDDPDLEIKGFSVFGATQTAYTANITNSPGNVMINGVLGVSSGAYIAGISTISYITNINTTSMTITGNGITGSSPIFKVANSTMVILNDGRVGIGMDNPIYKLDISGDIRVTGAIYANANGTKYFCGGDDSCFWDINVSNTVGIYGTQDPTVGSLKLGSGGGIISGYNNNIGIGITNPVYKLDIQGGDINASGNLREGGTALSAKYAYVSGTNVSGTWPISITGNAVTATSAGNADTVDNYHAGNSSGQVPISNGAVNTNLNADMVDGYHVSGTWPISITGNAATATSASNADTVDGYHLNQDVRTTAAPSFAGGTFIKNTGDSSSSALQAKAQGTAQGQRAGISFYPTFMGTGDNGPRRAADIVAGYNNGAWGKEYLAFYVNSTQNDVGALPPERMRITGTGYLYLSGGAYSDGYGWYGGSDRAYKKDIDYDFKYGLDEVKKLQPVYYIYKSDKDNKRQVGFIAQDVIKVIPEVVSGEDGSYGLNYANLTAVLTNAIKEQQKEIESLKTRLDELKAEVEKLKQK